MKDLQQINSKACNDFGRKAANLGEAVEMGLPVPKGFALSYQDFDLFMSNNGIHYQPSQYIAYGPQIIDQILQGTFSQEFDEELRRRIDKLQAESACTSFVVRSSSGIEDSADHSMAGMFESYLKLTSFDEIEMAVRKCYSALYSDKVLNYLLEEQLDASDLRMGVLIQEYIEGDAFGVLFTSDPVSGLEDQIHFSIFEGESSSLTRRASSTGIYSIHKQTGELSAKSQEQALVIPDETLQIALLSLAQSCEIGFGSALDIEWTRKNTCLYLLQVRSITALHKQEFYPEWNEVGQGEHEWFRLYETPLKPLLQDIVADEIKEQSKASLETLFRTDTYGECTICKGYAYVRSIPIAEEARKRKEYLSYLEELAQKGICIYHDLHLPSLLSYSERLKGYACRRLSRTEIEQYLRLSKEYHGYCVKSHWPMVQANEFLYRFEREFLERFQELALSDFYDLVSGFTLQTRDRELLFHMCDAVNQNPSVKAMFSACPYDAVLYERLLHTEAAEELLKLIQMYLEEYGVCDSLEGEELKPVLQERPDYILGYLRRLLEMDSGEFYHNLETAKERKGKVLNQVRSLLNNEEMKDFDNKLNLAERAFLSNDNHNYYVERSYRGYLRMAILAAEELLREEGMIRNKDDIQYLHYEEILALLQGKAFDEKLISERRREYEYQLRLDAPELLTPERNEESNSNSMENYTQKLKRNHSPGKEEEPPRLLKGVSGLRKRVRGKVYVGIPEVAQEAILVMPHCHYGDIMPIISKVKGLIFLWGSPYDHPAIIARELGIPAMYYVSGAMELLKTGDEVEIDGYEGLVHIISRTETPRMI